MMMMVGREDFKRHSGDLQPAPPDGLSFNTLWFVDKVVKEQSSFSLKYLSFYLCVHALLTESLHNNQEIIHFTLLHKSTLLEIIFLFEALDRFKNTVNFNFFKSINDNLKLLR